MNKTALHCSVAAALVVGMAAAPVAAADTLRAVPVDATGPFNDPESEVWDQAPAVTVSLNPQQVTRPHHADIAVTELTVRAVNNGNWVGILIEWDDDTRDDWFVTDAFGDQVAVQFPVEGPASPMMGNPGGKVNILQWRAAFQRDLVAGEPDIRDLYPYALVDVYPDEVLRVTDARAFAGAMGVDNPVARPFESPVLEQMAEGWGSLTVKPMQHADGWGVWEDGTWRVAITRPANQIMPGDPDLSRGTETQAAFAVWDGGNREVGGRKSWSGWIDLKVEE
ncbi:ethylbenzene dehydrogenase-related protein [Thioalkalivibrio sp. ARh3]|uniref:ethylbenzene dehydrogenase-related protein n=1 Tax=Thioalkalivibrio sp. ARh3 TaxID=1158148 RepID=UPI000371D6A9|nr:ethylbenzene dehydrogenase-related protein [Thioalkalivibrio sp. ARh3]